MALRKPSDFFGKNQEENDSNTLPIVEDSGSLREELNKVESLSEQVVKLQQEISQKVVKNDLESLILSQINSMQENFEYLQNDFRKSNKKDIAEFRDKVSELTEIVGNLVENELPKYKKQVTKNELNISEKLDTFKEDVKENITDIRYEVDTKVNSIVEVIDESLGHFNSQLQETSSEVKRTADTYNKLSKIVESKVSKENEKLEEYSQVIQSLYETFVELEENLQKETSSYLQIIEEKFETISSDVNDKIDILNEEVKSFEDNVSAEVSNIKADVVINEQHIKNVDKYLQENHQELVTLREEVFAEIEQIPVGNLQENLERLEQKIDYIKETYSKIEPEVIVKEVIQEGLLNIPPEEKTSDPLSPLNQNFVTLDQLQNHYKLFINRIQQQLSTLGGGGEYRFRFLDGIVGIKTNPDAYDGKYLKWNSTTKQAEFSTVSGGAGSQTLDTTLHLGNTSSLGMSVGVITATYFVGDGSLLTNVPGSANSGYANTAGIATYATKAGIATYASIAGFATVATQAGVASLSSYSYIAGFSTYAGNVGFATFSGVSGFATYATTAGISTVAQNLTGSPNITVSSVNSSGVVTASSFSGSGANLTSLNASNISSGTVPSFAITASSGNFTVGQNLYVTGALSVGGTSVILNAATLQVQDKDIVVGYTTDANNNDISNDNTANHGGISVASTVGSPLINIPLQVGVNSNPSTYKQLMWIKQGNYSGMGTDAWVFNYGVSIGNTATVQTGSRLTVGAGFTVFDTYLDAQDIRTRNINATGIITASSFSGNASSATYATSSGISTYSSTAGIATYATTSGIATYATSSGIATYATNAGIATYATSSGIATYATNAGTSTSVIGGIGSITQLQVSGISTFTNGPVLVGTSTATGTTGQPLQVTGSAYISGDSNSVGLGIGVTNATVYPLDIRLTSGATVSLINLQPSTGTRSSTIRYINSSSSNMITGLLNSGGFGQGMSGLTAYAGVVGLTAGTTPLLFVTNALERARITDTGLVGIGSTTPTSALTVQGDTLVSGVVTATSFSGSGTNLTGIVTSIVAGTNITISGSTGQVTINSSGGGTPTYGGYQPVDLLESMLFS